MATAINDACSYKVEGYFWSQAYKKGFWDGQEHLLKFDRRSREYVAPIGLLEDVQSVLESNKTQYTIKDNRKDREPIEVGWDGRIKPRRYQLAAIKAGMGGGIINMPIRSGKTKTAAALIALTKRSTIFIVPSKQLLHQTRAVLEEALDIPIGMIGDSEWQVEDVVVASIQTLARMRNTTTAKADQAARRRWPKVLATMNKNREKGCLTALGHMDVKIAEKAYVAEAIAKANEVRARWKSICGRFAMVIMDECHHLTADEWHDAVIQLDCRWRVGLSATAYPDRAKEQAKGVIWLKAICGPIRIQITMSELIKQGYLCPTRIIWRTIREPDRRGRRWSNALHKDCILLNRARNLAIIDDALQYAAGGHRVLIVSGRLEQVGALSMMARDRGIAHSVVTGTDSIEERSRKIALLISGVAPVMMGTVFGEGVDIPEIDVVINAEGGADDISTVQRLRCLTKLPGKELAIVVDFNDLTNAYFEKHSRARLRVYKSEPAFEIVKV